jgi:hypothetical protein
MKYGLLILAAVALLAIGVVTSRPALAGPAGQAAGTPAAGQTADPRAPQPAPANLVGTQQSSAVGYFPAVCLSTGIIAACVAALVAGRRDRRKAARIEQRNAAQDR